MSPGQWLSRLRAAATRPVAALPAVVVLVLAGGLLVVDRGGLRGEYRALGAPWQGEPYAVRVGVPHLAPRQPAPDAELGPSDVLISPVLFSVRWSGWWRVGRAGEYRFAVDADDGAWVRLDGELVIDTEGRFGAPVAERTVALEPGYHALEVAYRQGDGESRLAIGVAPVPLPPGPLAVDELYAGRPLAPRSVVRRALSGWSRPYRQLLGAALLVVAAVWVAATARGTRGADALARALDGAHQRVLASRRLRAALLAGLVVAAFFAALPFAGTIRGGDDAVYLSAATFDEASWFFHRYAHVFLVKAFVVLAGGDPFLGTRLWWSFAFAVTVGALALAVRSTGPGLQLPTFAVTLFVLLAQTTLLGRIGAAFSDVSSMMFVAAAVAVWMHDVSPGRPRAAGRFEWHAVAVGALTVAAWHAKEVGAVGFALLAFYALDGGRLDLRRWARRAVGWLLGAAAVLGALVLLDGWLLGDLLFLFDGARRAAADHMNFPERMAPRGAAETWLSVIWDSGNLAGITMRNLWLAVGAAAIAAGVRRVRPELRLLHLLPIAYLLALIALYVRLPHPFSGRMLLTIVPVACLAVGLLARHAGLEEIPWRRLATPRIAVPAALVAAILSLLVIPFQLGAVGAAEVVPAGLVGRYGWSPERFVSGVLAPALLLGAVATFALVAASREARLAALLLVLLALFGPGFAVNARALAARQAIQTGDLLLYPWREFRSELDAARPRKVHLSMDLYARYGMAERARSAVAGLALGRERIGVGLDHALPRDVDLAIGSPAAYERWRLEQPGLAATAVRDRAGFLVLVRPKPAEAPGGARRGGRGGVAKRSPRATRP
ncbi:MAG: hypothetical protein AMXMBFR36_02290 [Acidobacteriota bacterium]